MIFIFDDVGAYNSEGVESLIKLNMSRDHYDKGVRFVEVMSGARKGVPAFLFLGDPLYRTQFGCYGSGIGFGAGHMNIGDALFSRTQQRLLAQLFMQAERSFYTKELIRMAKAGSGAVQRELVRLEAAGLVVVSWRGNQKHYQANRASPVFAELHGLVVKSFGVVDVLRQALAPLCDRIQAAWLFGSLASGEEHNGSDVDVLVVADDLDYPELLEALATAEKSLARTVNPVLYSSDELLRRRLEKNHFTEGIFSQPMVWLWGREDDGFAGAGKSGATGPVETRAKLAPGN